MTKCGADDLPESGKVTNGLGFQQPWFDVGLHDSQIRVVKQQLVKRRRKLIEQGDDPSRFGDDRGRIVFR